MKVQILRDYQGPSQSRSSVISYVIQTYECALYTIRMQEIFETILLQKFLSAFDHADHASCISMSSSPPLEMINGTKEPGVRP